MGFDSWSFWERRWTSCFWGWVGKTYFQCSQWAQGLENHAPHLTNSSSMSVTTCFRYVLTFVFDGLAFGMWGRRGSYMRKLLRLHYMGNWKYVIMPNQTFYQKRYTWRLDSPIKPFLRISTVSSIRKSAKYDYVISRHENRTAQSENGHLLKNEHRKYIRIGSPKKRTRTKRQIPNPKCGTPNNTSNQQKKTNYNNDEQKAKKSFAQENQAVRIYSFSRVRSRCSRLLVFRALYCFGVAKP